MDKTSLFHKHLSKNLTDLDDGPLLDNNCVIGRRRRASLLVHEQSLQRSRHRLAWNTQTVAVTQTSVWKTHGHVFVVKTEKFIFIFLRGMVLIDKVTVVELKLLRGHWMTLRKSALWIKWSNCAVSQLKTKCCYENVQNNNQTFTRFLTLSGSTYMIHTAAASQVSAAGEMRASLGW